MNNTEKIDAIFNILGISNDLNSNNIIDELFEKLTHIQEIAKFNTILIQEMIKSDIIPPLLLKRSQLLLELKSTKEKLTLLSNRYEIYKNQNSSKEILNSIAKDMLETQNKIEELEKELNHL